MYFGDEKARQMARSILPSKARVSAKKELQDLRRKDRRRIHQELQQLVLDYDEELESELEPDQDLRHYPDRKIKYAVRERRGADKLHHFEKWAIEITKDIKEPDGRLSRIKKILPKGMIGIHAISHLKSYDEFESDLCRFGRRSYYNYKRPTVEEQHQERLRLLADVCRSGTTSATAWSDRRNGPTS